MWYFKKLNSETESRWWLTGAGASGEMIDLGQRIQTSSCKMNKLWGCQVQHGDYSY